MPESNKAEGNIKMKLGDVASNEYRNVLRATHAANNNKWGGGGKGHATTIIEFMAELGAVSVLDYGCGRGTLKTALDAIGGYDVREFDPGIPGKDAMPEPADVVVATDVLEHIEPEKVYLVLKHIRELSIKGTFLIIALTPAKLVLTDGRNAHLSVHSHEWWYAVLQAQGFNVVRHEKHKGFHVWAKS